MSDTLTTAHNFEVVAEVNGYTDSKSFEIVEIYLKFLPFLDTGKCEIGDG